MNSPKTSNGNGGSQRTSPRTTSSEVPRKKSSPQASSPGEIPQKASPRVARQIKSFARYSEPTASSLNLSRTPKERSPKVGQRKAPTSPVSEDKCSGRVLELECQISQLEADLKTVKDQLHAAEASKQLAKNDSEESNQHLLALSSELKESQKQIFEHSASEEVNRIVLHEALEGHNLVLQSELEAVQKKHSNDLSMLASALDEIELLKIQLETVAVSEANQTGYSESAHAELCALKESMVEALSLFEDMKNQVRGCKESEARSQELVVETLKQLETSKRMVETLRLDGFQTVEAYSPMMLELNQSKARVKFLDGLVSKLNDDISEEESRKLNLDLETRVEAEQLRSALEAVETKLTEEQAQSRGEMKAALETLEEEKSRSSQREAELVSELTKSRVTIEEMKAKLMDKETELQGICEENEELTAKLENTLSGETENGLKEELKQSKVDVQLLKTRMMDKEIEWRNAIAENEALKLKLQKVDNSRVCDEAVSDMESTEAAEREALFKIACLSEEVDKSKRRACRASEQLEAAQRANGEMEGELRRVKVQCDQWRKAAEAAAAMLSTENNGHVVQRTGSMDSSFSPRMGKMSSPYADDLDEDFLKKKNANMLRKLGILWKKQQK